MTADEMRISDWISDVCSSDLRSSTLRYCENPHQYAALYLPLGPSGNGIAQSLQIQGKELSYNNYNDADAALELVSEFRDGPPTVVIVKHANPCGVATGATLIEAYEAALACDSVSAFGGIIAVNRPLDGPTAEAIRSEEHTSELQSLMRTSYAVFCLKQKQTQKQ